MTISANLRGYIDSTFSQHSQKGGSYGLIIGTELSKFVKDIEKLEKMVNDQSILLSNLNILAKLNPILAIVLKSAIVSEEVKSKITNLLDRIITSILQSEDLLGK